MSNVRRIAVLDETGKLPSEMLPFTPGPDGPNEHPDEATHIGLGLVAGTDPRLSDARSPSAHAHAEYATDAALLAHAGTAHGLSVHAIDGAYHSGSEVLPSAGQKNALAGTAGTPGTTNPYVTQQDTRLTDPRTPLAHVHPQSDVTALASDLSGKAPTAHTHPYADVGHTHPGGGSPFVRKAADQAFTAVALADVADLAVPLGVNADVGFEFLIVWQSAATTTGVQFALNGPAGLVELTALVEVQLTQTTWQTAVHTTYNGGAVTASIDAANTRRIARIKGGARNGATAGSLTLRCRTEVANSAITVKRGSFATYV